MVEPMNNGRTTIAILDDEVQMRKALGRLLRTHGFLVETHTMGSEMLQIFSEQLPDCLLLDLHMPGMTGFEVMEALRARHCPVPVIVITGHDEPKNAERVLLLGAVAYLTKPIDETILLSALQKAMGGSCSKEETFPEF
ncbi:MAG: hypothetical protein JWM59_1955 [Verrucomicrobiales bacterium]|nr:hypothetical protein [Verrucomicrobiales bacterium]